MVVSSTNPESEELIVATLCGEYIEHSSNHGRKVYKRKHKPDEENVEVWMYYWDERDGPNFQGWWFGNQLGGTQVWSHNVSANTTPPKSGWKVPWDGEVRDTMVVTPKPGTGRSGAAPVAAASSGVGPLDGTLSRVATEAKQALEELRGRYGGDYVTPEATAAAEQTLQQHTEALTDALRQLTAAQRSAPPGDARALQQLSALGTLLRSAQTNLQKESTKVKAAKVRVAAVSTRAAIERDEAILGTVIPEATERTNAAEDAVEKARITAEMIEASGDDLAAARDAVRHTEQAAKEAQKLVGEARIFLNARQAQCRRMESESVREKALAQLLKLSNALQEAQNRLNPLKTVGSDFQHRAAAHQLTQETLERLTPAEMQVDKAEEATLLIATDGGTKSSITKAEAAVTDATRMVDAVLKFLATKRASSQGAVLLEIERLENRTRASHERLAELRKQQKEAGEQNASDTMIEEAAEKLRAVVQNVSKATDAESPFLMGMEDLPLDQTLAAVKAVDSAATLAHTACSIARMFFATKVVEARRLTDTVGKKTLAKLKEHQAELDVQMKKLADIKKANGTRKREATMREAQSEVAKAEQLASAVGEAAAVLKDDGKLLELSASELRAAAEDLARAEQAAAAAVAAARKFLTDRQLESKGQSGSAADAGELIKLQTRLSAAHGDIATHKKSCGSVEARLAAKRTIEEAHGKVQALEVKLEKFAEALEQLGLQAEGEAADDRSRFRHAEELSAEVQVALRSTQRWLESHGNSQGVTKSELDKLRPRAKGAQDKFETMMASLRERTEKQTIEQLLKEAELPIQQAEESFEKVTAAEEPFLKGVEDQPDEAKLLATLEAAVNETSQVLQNGKTVLAMKRLSAKRLSEGSAARAMEHLGVLQERFDAVSKNVAATKSGITERKVATVRRHGAEQLAAAEKMVADAVECTKALSESTVMETADMKSLCEKAGTAQQAASTVVSEAKNFLQQQQRDTKLLTADASMHSDLSKLLEKLSASQVELDKQKALLRDQEHKFVAQRLMKDAEQWIDRLDKKLQALEEMAAPLADETSGVSSMYLSQIMAALQKHQKETSKTSSVLFEEMSEKASSLTEAKFVAYLTALPEMSEESGTKLTEDQLKLAFRGLGSKAEEATEPELTEALRCRHSIVHAVAMTDILELKGGKTVKKLEVNDVVEQLEAPVTEPSVGLLRVKVKTQPDGVEGFVTITSTSGTTYLTAYDAMVVLENKVNQAMQELLEAAGKAQKYIEAKAEELRTVREGPLAATRAALQALEPRVRHVQQERKKLKTTILEAKKKQAGAIESEKRRIQEVQERVEAEKVLSEVTVLAAEADEQVEKAVTTAQDLVASRGADTENPMQAMEAAEKALTACTELVEQAGAKIKQQMDGVKNAGKGPLADARGTLVKMKVKVGALDTRCRRQLTALAGTRKQVTRDAETALQAALRAHAVRQGLKPAELLRQLAGEDGAVAEAALRAHLEGIPESGIKPCHLELGVGALAASISKLTILDMVQEYQRCVKEIALTSAYEVKESKSLRKLAVGELVEVLEEKKGEGEGGLHRARCRALKDAKEGWATLMGNQGTPFLERAAKPYMMCEEPVKLQQAAAAGSGAGGAVERGEVLELLEGPREEAGLESLRVKGKAAKDGQVGWVTLKDVQGLENLKKEKMLVCLRSIAFTSAFDITEGKALRKLDVGEALDVIEGPQEDTVRGLTRAKARAKSDGKEGWVTLKGNQGTAYAEESDKNYVVTSAISLDKRLKSGGEALRQLEVGEVFEVLEGPERETHSGAVRARARSVRSGAEGWVTMSKALRDWAPRYKCMQSTVLNDVLVVKDAKVVRKVEAGELMDALDLPTLEESDGLWRVRARAAKDGVSGWVTIRGNMGTEVMKPMIEGQEPELPKVAKAPAEPPRARPEAGASRERRSEASRPLAPPPLLPPPEPPSADRASRARSSGGASGSGRNERDRERDRERERPRREERYERPPERRDVRYERRDGYERPQDRARDAPDRREPYARRDGYERRDGPDRSDRRRDERRDGYERRDPYERRDGYERSYGRGDRFGERRR